VKLLLAPVLIALAMAFPSLAQVRTPIELPADPSTAVIVFEDRGSMGWSFRRNYNPVLTVRADGSVTAVDPLGDANGFQGKLSPSELQDLLRFAIEEQGFFSFTPSGVFEPVPPEAECILSGNSHYKSTYIRIQTRDRQHEALADQGRGGIPIEQFEILEKRLRRLAEVVKSGAKDRIPEALGRANEFLMRTHRELRPLTIEEFFKASRNSSGTRDFVFRHEERDGSWFQVVVPESPARQVQPVFQNGIEPERTYPNAKDILAYLYDFGLISEIPELLCDGTGLKLPN
jgi:hypothetical protein